VLNRPVCLLLHKTLTLSESTTGIIAAEEIAK